MDNSKDKRKAYVYLVITFVLWGSLYVISKFVLGKLPTFTISFLRFIIAFFALTLFSTGKKFKKIEKQDTPYLFLIGIGGYFIAEGAQLLGTKYAGASMASLLNSLNPVTMTIFAAIILHEKMTPRKIIGILLALLGVYAILGGDGGGVGGSAIGIGLSLFSVLFWSFVSVFMRKIGGKYDSIQITRYGIGIAAVCYAPVAAYEIFTAESINMDVSCVLGLLYMGIVCTGVAYLLWNKSLAVLEASTCSAFYPVQPLVSALLGTFLLGETTGIWFWIGAVLIVAGVFVNLSGNRQKCIK